MTFFLSHIRLTRDQKKKADLMKLKMAAPQTTVSRKRQRKPSTADPEDDDDINDTASVSSVKTRSSTRSKKSIEDLTPVRQSKRLKVRSFSAPKFTFI